MALVLPASVFFHVPKTGGQWVARAVVAAGIPVEQVGPVHADPSEVATDPRVVGRPSFAFVRHPLSWYASMWAHRQDEGWDEIDAVDWFSPAWLERMDAFSRTCRSGDFGEFVERALDGYPEGFVSTLYRSYVEGRTEVGRQESLVDDLVGILGRLGERFDEAALRATGSRNVRASSGRRLTQSVYDRELVDRVMDVERWAVATFGYEEPPGWVRSTVAGSR